MRHDIPVGQLPAQAEEMAAAVTSCVHCGFCLPTCPTYATLGDEMNSPRGRILLMKQVLEGELEREGAMPFIDNCLGCQSCVSACPSGVECADLTPAYRAWNEPQRTRPPMDRARRRVLLSTLPY